MNSDKYLFIFIILITIISHKFLERELLKIYYLSIQIFILLCRYKYAIPECYNEAGLIVFVKRKATLMFYHGHPAS